MQGRTANGEPGVTPLPWLASRTRAAASCTGTQMLMPSVPPTSTPRCASASTTPAPRALRVPRQRLCVAVAGATAETDSRMTTAPAPLLVTLPRRRPRRRAPAERTTVVPLEGDLEARPRELEAELGARLCRDATLVLDLRGATFLGAGAARLLLDLRSQAAAGGRLVLWRPEGQPFRTLRIVRFDRVFELRPASWRPPRSRDGAAAADLPAPVAERRPNRVVQSRAGGTQGGEQGLLLVRVGSAAAAVGGGRGQRQRRAAVL